VAAYLNLTVTTMSRQRPVKRSATQRDQATSQATGDEAAVYKTTSAECNSYLDRHRFIIHKETTQRSLAIVEEALY
jgi:hypothetical protein